MQVLRDLISFCDAHSGFLLAVLTSIYVAATLILVLLASRQFRFATELERNRTRPNVGVDIVKDRFHVNLLIKNFGLSEALDIKVEINPLPKLLYTTPRAEAGETSIPFLSNGIGALAPGREVKALIGPWPRFCQRYPQLKFTGHISYRSAGNVLYNPPFNVDLSAEEGLASVERYDLHDIAKTLRELLKELKDVGSGYRKPLIRTISESAYQEQEDAAIAEALRPQASSPDQTES